MDERMAVLLHWVFSRSRVAGTEEADLLQEPWMVCTGKADSGSSAGAVIALHDRSVSSPGAVVALHRRSEVPQVEMCVDFFYQAACTMMLRPFCVSSSRVDYAKLVVIEINEIDHQLRHYLVATVASTVWTQNI